MWHVWRDEKYKILVRRPEGDHSEDTDVDGTIILEQDLKGNWWEDMNWMHLAKGRDQWLSSCEHDNEPRVP
jgi:hypothetical protein